MAQAIAVLSSGAGATLGKDIVGGAFSSAIKAYSTAYAKQAEGSDAILNQLALDMEAVSSPIDLGAGGNVYVQGKM